jgi:enterochelin esterase family protein
MRIILSLIVLIFSLHSIQSKEFADLLIEIQNTPDSIKKSLLLDAFINEKKTFPLISDQSCLFLYRGSQSRVILTGDHKNWSGNGDTLQRISGTNAHYISKNFPQDARLDYKFIVGSNWILDPLNPLTCMGGFGANSELRMSNYPKQPELILDPTLPKGTIIDTSFRSQVLNNNRTVKVYLPPLYSELDTTQYPLIIFHDGLDYINLGNATQTLNYLIANKVCEPIIAVFIPAINRNAEYAGNQMQQFSDFVVNDIIGWVDKRFKTKREPDCRAVAGASNGGNIALYFGMAYPNQFGKIAAQSSNIITSISTAYNANTLPLQVYVDIGTYDIPVLIPMVKNFKQILSLKKYNFIYNEYSEGHSWGNWKAHMDTYLSWFFPFSTMNAYSKNMIEHQLIKVHRTTYNDSEMIVDYETSTSLSPLTISLISVQGEILSSLTLPHTSIGLHTDTLSVKHLSLASGIYFLRFNNSKSSVTEKIFLNNR